MIISHKYRYLFIENPLTASYAIHTELCKSYDGIRILHKHATYQEFINIASPSEREYYIFMTIRNPLDKLASRYVKYKIDARGTFSDPHTIEKNLSDYSDRIKFEYIKNSNASFEDYFLRFYKRPYSDLIDTIPSIHLNYLIRFESLQDDFAQVLDSLGINQARPLPVVNKTPGKRTEWVSYYTPSIYERAKKVCGPFMEKWGYDFPSEWGDHQVSWGSKLEFHLTCILKNVYFSYFRNNDHFYARLIRKLRAALLQ